MCTDRKQPLNLPVMRMRVWIDRRQRINHGRLVLYFTDLIIYYHIKESHAKDIEIDKHMLQQDWREPCTQSEVDTLAKRSTQARLGQVVW